MTKPKPLPEIDLCPFCGSRKTAIWDELGKVVRCSKCEALGPLRETERGAINAWNKAPRERNDFPKPRSYGITDVLG